MAATDTFSTFTAAPDGPYLHAASVTPDDNNDLATASRALFVGVAGNVAVVTVGGETVTLTGCTAGSVIPIRAARVKSTNTTATAILALW